MDGVRVDCVGFKLSTARGREQGKGDGCKMVGEFIALSTEYLKRECSFGTPVALSHLIRQRNLCGTIKSWGFNHLKNARNLHLLLAPAPSHWLSYSTSSVPRKCYLVDSTYIADAGTKALSVSCHREYSINVDSIQSKNTPKLNDN